MKDVFISIQNSYACIYNSSNKLVYKGIICNKLKLCLDKGIYKILITPPHNINKISMYRVFIVSDCCNIFSFEFKNNRLITLKFIDINYTGLKIERGLINLEKELYNSN